MGSPAERKRQSKESVNWEDRRIETTQSEQKTKNALKKKVNRGIPIHSLCWRKKKIYSEEAAKVIRKYKSFG